MASIDFHPEIKLRTIKGHKEPQKESKRKFIVMMKIAMISSHLSVTIPMLRTTRYERYPVCGQKAENLQTRCMLKVSFGHSCRLRNKSCFPKKDLLHLKLLNVCRAI